MEEIISLLIFKLYVSETLIHQLLNSLKEYLVPVTPAVLDI